MGEGNHLPVPGSTGKSKGQWTWMLGGAAVAVLATGLLMQYVRSPSSKAASDPPATQAGQARVGKPAAKPESLAKVGKDSITYDAVAEECVKRYGREVLDDLIHRLIIQQACEKNNVTVNDQEISEEITRIAKRFNLDVNQWLQMLQAERNITPAQYRQSVIYPMIALKKLVDAEDAASPSEKEINQAFIRNYGQRVKARMIMFDQLRRAQASLDQIEKNPDDFEQLATKLSVDPNSRALGGQIPPIPMYNGNDALEKAAFSLKRGQISGIIEVAPSRFVVLKCEGRTEPVVDNIDEVRDTLYDELKESKIQAAIATKFDEIKKHTTVDNYLTGYSSRTDHPGSSTGVSSGIQPASATQPKQNSSPTRNPNSAAAPPKAARN